MSRPIYEPSLPRADAELGYGSRQLFRRPAPRGAEGGELPFAYMNWVEGADIPTDAEVNPADWASGVPYSDGYINDAGLAMLPEPFALDLDSGNITFACNGLYSAQFTAVWADTWVAGTRVYTSLVYTGSGPGPLGSWATREPITNNTDETADVGTGLWVVHDSEQGFPFSIEGHVMQESGTDKFLTSCHLIIVRLEIFDDTTGQFYPITS